ncbi:MAG: peptidoglycan hydrolase CwlO-like protein [Natronomonas sp.]|jgi:peptidoglycan hydrolase CwlO-like protein|uniref:DUF7518 family protein n=1 Tax=Natronomonas sp. TaxID=2184060 RepID=UPI003989CECA
MAGNRVDELEAEVRELKATIDGLTDELVETKERLQAIEDETGVEPDVLKGRTSHKAQQTTTEQAADDGEASADEVNTDEADGEDNTDSESGDDIIVA